MRNKNNALIVINYGIGTEILKEINKAEVLDFPPRKSIIFRKCLVS